MKSSVKYIFFGLIVLFSPLTLASSYFVDDEEKGYMGWEELARESAREASEEYWYQRVRKQRSERLKRELARDRLYLECRKSSATHSEEFYQCLGPAEAERLQETLYKAWLNQYDQDRMSNKSGYMTYKPLYNTINDIKAEIEGDKPFCILSTYDNHILYP